jgi:putative ABC transport system permease protein
MIGKLAWKNLWFKPMNTVLSLVLLSASVAIITLLILMQEQFEKQFSSNIDGVDLVLGAQGSPLQLILSSVYQVDAPTGNIDYKEAQSWMKHPFVASAIPLAFGDNYRGFKIVGTTPEYLAKYQATVEEGVVFKNNFEVVLGSEVARKLGMQLGDIFSGTHGDAEEGHVHDEFNYKVVGIAVPTGRVIDNLILSNIESVWAIHEEHEHGDTEATDNPPHGEEGHVHIEGDEHDHDHEGHDHEGHNHDAHNHDQESVKEITAVLIKFKNKMGIISWPRMIAQNTKMQAALPAIEVNRLVSLFGIGIEALQYLAYGIMAISGISIFIALYNRLKERKYEFALLRVSGASRFQLLRLVLMESVLLCVVGFLFGIVFGRLALWYISQSTDEEFKFAFEPWTFMWEKEGVLLLLTIFVGIIAAVIPAIKAYRLNISKTLANA